MKKLFGASLGLFAGFALLFGGALAQTANGRATTNPPSYSNGVAAPLSLDTDGNLRIICLLGCGTDFSSFGGAFPTEGLAVGLSDGTNMLPFRGDVTSGLWVNIKSPTTFPISAAALPLPAGAATAANQTTIITNLGSPFQTGGSIGNTAFALNAGSNLIGKVGIDQTTPGTTNAVQNIAGTSGGAFHYHLIATASTNSNSIKGSAATLYAVQVYNNSANIAYLKFYDKASAPTCNTDSVIKTVLIPASTSGAGANFSIPVGERFSLGLGFCVTGGIADNDNTAVAASAFAINITYQ